MPSARCSKLALVVAGLAGGCAIDPGATQPGQVDASQDLSAPIIFSAMQDSWIDAKNQTQNDGAQSRLHVRSGSPVRRALVQFDLSPVVSQCPAGVATADLQLFLTNSGSARSYEAHALTASWTERGVNFRTRDGLTPWSSLGGDFNATPTSTVSLSNSKNVTVHFDVTVDVAAGATNHGWRIARIKHQVDVRPEYQTLPDPPPPRENLRPLPVYGVDKPSVKRRGARQQAQVGARRRRARPPSPCCALCSAHPRPRLVTR